MIFSAKSQISRHFFKVSIVLCNNMLLHNGNLKEMP